MSSLVKIIIIVLVLAGVGFLGYGYLTKANDPKDLLVQQDLGNTSRMGAEILSALNQLKTLKLDSGVFKDKVFMSLQDFSKPLNPEPVGRANPFSPIGVEVGSFKNASTSSVSTATSSKTATTSKALGN